IRRNGLRHLLDQRSRVLPAITLGRQPLWYAYPSRAADPPVIRSHSLRQTLASLSTLFPHRPADLPSLILPISFPTKTTKERKRGHVSPWCTTIVTARNQEYPIMIVTVTREAYLGRHGG